MRDDTYPRPFNQISDHHNNVDTLLPHHSPIIVESRWHGTLGANISFWLLVSVDVVGVDVIRIPATNDRKTKLSMPRDPGVFWEVSQSTVGEYLALREKSHNRSQKATPRSLPLLFLCKRLERDPGLVIGDNIDVSVLGLILVELREV